MLTLILPAYLAHVTRECAAERLRQRDVINEIKTLLNLGRDRCVRQALDLIGTDFDALVPIEQLKSSGLQKLERFAHAQWPEHEDPPSVP